MQGLKGFSKGLFITDKDIKAATAPTGIRSNKYSKGSVLVVGGSNEYKGAMLMAALAALRTGCGYVTIAAPRRIIDIASKLSPVFVVRELNGAAEHDAKTVASVRHNVIVLGPGLDPSTNTKFLNSVIKNEEKAKNNIIIDGAILKLVKKFGSNMSLTPHDGEFKAMTGINLERKSFTERVKAARSFAKTHKCTLVLKGHETIIAKGNRIKVNVSKSPVLATMGTGDVLCGIIAAYAASHHDPFESAVAGVCVHSVAGAMLYKKKGLHITAQDVIDAIPDVLKRFDVIR